MFYVARKKEEEGHESWSTSSEGYSLDEALEQYAFAARTTGEYNVKIFCEVYARIDVAPRLVHADSWKQYLLPKSPHMPKEK